MYSEWKTYLLRLDDEALLEQPMPYKEQLLVQLGDPESVTVDAGELEQLQYGAVKQGIADWQRQLDVANVPWNRGVFSVICEIIRT